MAAPVPDLVERHRGHVYEPSDDTFLFLDALQDELEYIRTVIQPSVAIEIGPGSGAVMTYIAHQFQEMYVVGIDVNPLAAESTYLTAQHNDIRYFDVIQDDLVTSTLDRLTHQVDLLLFNPPYVPTDPEEVGSKGIEAAWAGGIDGRQVIDRLLPLVSTLLSPTGVFYLVTVQDNKPHEIADLMAGFAMTTIRTIKARNERLAIQKFTRS